MLPRIDKKRDDGLFAKDRGESSTITAGPTLCARFASYSRPFPAFEH